jgi:hypothetical protein
MPILIIVNFVQLFAASMEQFLAAAAALVSDLSHTVQSAKSCMVCDAATEYIWHLTFAFFLDNVGQVFWWLVHRIF